MIKLVTALWLSLSLLAAEPTETRWFEGMTRDDLTIDKIITYADPGTGQDVSVVVTKILPPRSTHDFEFEVVDVNGAGSGGNGTSGHGDGSKVKSGTGRGLGSGLGTGVSAGAVHAAIGGIYHAVIMTPDRVRELKRALDEVSRSEGQRIQAESKLAAAREANHVLRNVIKVKLSSPSTTVDPFVKFKPKFELPPNIFTGNQSFDSRAGPVFEKLNHARPRDEAGQSIKEFGTAALEVGAVATRQGDVPTSEAALKVATEAADLLVGLDPVTATIRSGYEVFTGKNMITGQPLSPAHRTLAGVIFGASLATGGATATLKGGFKLAAKIVGRVPKGAISAGSEAVREGSKLAERLSKAGWSEKKIADFGEFSRNVLGEQIRDVDYAIDAAEHWAVSSQATFPKVLRELNGSPKELQMMADELGMDVVTLTERRAKAIGFYNDTRKYQGNLKEIYQEIKGIDLREEVQVVRLPSGQRVKAWAHPESEAGHYYTVEMTSPDRLGIGNLAQRQSGELFAKEIREYEVIGDTRALRSTAAEIEDNFSVHKSFDGSLGTLKDGVEMSGVQYAPGGATQYVIQPQNLRRIQ